MSIQNCTLCLRGVCGEASAKRQRVEGGAVAREAEGLNRVSLDVFSRIFSDLSVRDEDVASEPCIARGDEANEKSKNIPILCPKN